MSHSISANDNTQTDPASAGRSLQQLALRTSRRYLLTAMMASILQTLLGLVMAVVLARAIAGIWQNLPIQNDVIRFAVAAVLRAGCSALADWKGAQAAAALKTDLRHRLVRALFDRGPAPLKATTSGAVSTVLMEQVEACDAYIARYLPQRAAALAGVPAALLLLGLTDWRALLVVLAGLLFLPLWLGFFGWKAGRASREQFLALSRMGGQFADRLRQLTLLRSFGAAEREQAVLAHTADLFRQRTMAVLRLAFLSAAAMDLVLAGCIVGSVSVFLFGDRAPVGQMLLALLLVLEVFSPLRALAAGYHDRASALAAMESIAPWLDLSAPRPIQLVPRPLPETLHQPSLDIQNISYTYPGRTRPALENFSLRIEGGEFVALTGPSGGGKSTLFQLLLGFMVPQSGLLALAQHPLAQIDPEQRAAAFSYVGQRTHLFYGTLADNVRLGLPQASDEDVRAALAEARLDQLLGELPNGLYTLIGDRGFGLSGGQAQRVALARAFLRNAPVLLLDEPTAGLDDETVSGLLPVLQSLARKRTVLMISHDQRVLAAAERIVTIHGTGHD